MNTNKYGAIIHDGKMRLIHITYLCTFKSLVEFLVCKFFKLFITASVPDIGFKQQSFQREMDLFFG